MEQIGRPDGWKEVRRRRVSRLKEGAGSQLELNRENRLDVEYLKKVVFLGMNGKGRWC